MMHIADAPAVSREMVVIIRPSFMKFCRDGCRAAVFNHILYWISRKVKNQPKDLVQNGEIMWYATTEVITEDLAHAWGVCKVRKEVNALIDMGVLRRSQNQTWGADRTKHFSFGKEQCAKLLDLCKEHQICLLHIGLPPEMTHLIDLSNANDTSVKCSCPDMGTNDTSIKCIRSIHQMETMDLSSPFDRSIAAITQDSTQMTTKDSTKRENNVHPTEATRVAALTLTSPSNDQPADTIISHLEIAQEQRTSCSYGPKEHVPVPLQVVTPPTTEDISGKASDQRSDPAAKSREKPGISRSKSTTPSSGALLLLDAWDQTNGRRLTRTKEQIEAAEELVRINATRDDLRNVRERLLSQKDGFWKARGVSLKNIANNFHLAALGLMPPPDDSRAPATPLTQSVTPSTQSKVSTVDTSLSRRLLRRVPSATQSELLPIDTSQEARSAQ